GIIPDVFVPIGTLEEEKVESLDSSGFFSDFIFRFLELDRSRFDKYPQNEFVDEYRVDDIIFERFIDYLLNRNIKMDFYGNEKKIKTYLKANIAEQLYSPDLASQIKSAHDHMLKRILELDGEELASDLQETLQD
ncbi:MAG: peptidase S41, partial [Bacteroidota bacterium]